MAWIGYENVPEKDRVDDSDNIIRIHGVHPAMTRRHVDLYRQLMRGPGPLSRAQREMIGVAVSRENGCHY